MKKRIRLGYLLLIILTMICCSGCGEKTAPPILTIQDINITIGSSHLSDLTSNGFMPTFTGNQMVIGDLSGKSRLADTISFKKDNNTYARVHIYNPDKNSKSYEQSVICQLEFCMHSEEESYWADDNCLVNGINFNGMTSEQVKDAMKEYTVAAGANTDSLCYEDGAYKYYISFNEGTGFVEKVIVELVLGEEYN